MANFKISKNNQNNGGNGNSNGDGYDDGDLTALDIAASKAHKNLLISNFKYYLNDDPAKNYKNFRAITNLPESFGSNQIINTSKDAELKSLLWNFNAPIRYAFGYGSGVFEQEGYKGDDKPQVDMIFGVTFSDHWHDLNVQEHPGHYSGASLLGSGYLAKIGDMGAGVYFNPYVEMNGQVLKYGVVSMDDMFQDLEEWSSLYIAGRLQKPVNILRDDPRLRFINQYNLKSVVALSMLLLSKKPSFHEFELYETIANISYLGDPRMSIGGENPKKVQNIVDKQYLNFRSLYNPLLNLFVNNLQPINDSSNEIYKFKQNLSVDSKAKLIQALPLQFRRRLYHLYVSEYGNELAKDKLARRTLELGSTTHSTLPQNDEITPYALALAADKHLVDYLVRTIQLTVYYPALIQTVKGVFTAGITRSVKYAWEKKSKYWKSK